MINYIALSTIMIAMSYSIIINNDTVYTTDSERAAFAAYRAYCRKFANKQNGITLNNHETIIQAKRPNAMLLDDIDNVTANDLLKIIMRELDIDIKNVKRVVKEIGLPLSNSRVGSWNLPSSNRRYTQMHNDELAVILPHLLQTKI